MARKFPLELLRRVRSDQVDEAARSLSAALSVSLRAKEARMTREHASADFGRKTRTEAEKERERLERGEQSAADLLRAAAWGVGVAAHKRALGDQVDAAKRKESAAEEQARERRAVLASAQQHAKLLEQSHARFERERESAALSSEDEEAHDVHLARARKEGKK